MDDMGRGAAFAIGMAILAAVLVGCSDGGPASGPLSGEDRSEPSEPSELVIAAWLERGGTDEDPGCPFLTDEDQSELAANASIVWTGNGGDMHACMIDLPSGKVAIGLFAAKSVDDDRADLGWAVDAEDPVVISSTTVAGGALWHSVASSQAVADADETKALVDRAYRNLAVGPWETDSMGLGRLDGDPESFERQQEGEAQLDELADRIQGEADEAGIDTGDNVSLTVSGDLLIAYTHMEDGTGADELCTIVAEAAADAGLDEVTTVSVEGVVGEQHATCGPS